MRRAEIATLIERYDEHERYGELTEDDRITHWLMKKVFELTKGEKEEPEVEKKDPFTYVSKNMQIRPGAVFEAMDRLEENGWGEPAQLDARRRWHNRANVPAGVEVEWLNELEMWREIIRDNPAPVPEAPRPQVVLQPRGGVRRFVNWGDNPFRVQGRAEPAPARHLGPDDPIVVVPVAERDANDF